MASELPIPLVYKKTKNGKTKVVPIMSSCDIPITAGMVSCCGGFAIPTRVPLSDKQVAAIKAAQQKADAEDAALNKSRCSIDSMDTVSKSKEELASHETQRKKITLGSWLSRFKK